MSDAADFRRIALSLEGTTEAPHFDRAAFKVVRIYATLAPGGDTANFRFAPDEQALKCTVAPSLFEAIPNAWGRQGWTLGHLASMREQDLEAALRMAWTHAKPRPKAKRRAH